MSQRIVRRRPSLDTGREVSVPVAFQSFPSQSFWSRKLWIGLSLAALAIAPACKDDPQPACTPGETQLCAGVDRCEGVQSCLDDGSGFADSCDCSVPVPMDFGQMEPEAPLTALVGRTCTEDAQCGEGLECLTSEEDTAFFGGGIANGYCSKPCTALEECTEIDGVAECVLNGSGDTGYCIRTCASRDPAPTESKCLGRQDLVCQSVAALGLETAGFARQRGWCYPQCNSDSDCGDRFCNLADGVCTDAPAVGKAVGERCEADGDCAGNICLGVTAEDATERLCSAPCRFSPPAAVRGCGDSLNESAREVGCVVPQVQSLFGSEDEGDLGFCLELCDVDSDCSQNADFDWGCFPSPGFSSQTGRVGICLNPQSEGDAGVGDASVPDSGTGDSGPARPPGGPDATASADASGT